MTARIRTRLAETTQAADGRCGRPGRGSGVVRRWVRPLPFRPHAAPVIRHHGGSPAAARKPGGSAGDRASRRKPGGTPEARQHAASPAGRCRVAGSSGADRTLRSNDVLRLRARERDRGAPRSMPTTPGSVVAWERAEVLAKVVPSYAERIVVELVFERYRASNVISIPTIGRAVGGDPRRLVGNAGGQPACRRPGASRRGRADRQPPRQQGEHSRPHHGRQPRPGCGRKPRPGCGRQPRPQPRLRRGHCPCGGDSPARTASLAAWRCRQSLACVRGGAGGPGRLAAEPDRDLPAQPAIDDCVPVRHAQVRLHDVWRVGS
jgi:hypothetical protein